MKAIATAGGGGFQQLRRERHVHHYVTRSSCSHLQPGGRNLRVCPVGDDFGHHARCADLFSTTDGSTPTTSSARYAGPIAVGTTTTVRAIATATGYFTSPVASAGYTIGQSGSTYYCYDGAGNMTAVCISGQVCSCP